MQPSQNEIRQLVDRLMQSDLCSEYCEAFHQTTGCVVHVNKSPVAEAETWPFVMEVRVPVEVGGRRVTCLSLDPVRLMDDAGDSFDPHARRLLDEGATAAEIRAAQQVFQSLPAMPSPRAESLRTMLRVFAMQLGELGEKLFLQITDAEPQAVRKARHYILHHLTEPLCLDDVSRQAGVSAFHFCKVFKKATGLTFTDFVNRARIEQAKRLLLKPQSRITEVAYDVGFQSLSQFNRTFRRVTTLSPTEFRSRMGSGRLLHDRSRVMVCAE